MEDIPKIEQNIPIPKTAMEVKGEIAAKESAVLKTLKIGESIFFEWDTEIGSANRLRNRLGSRICYAMPFKFTVRVWPTEDPQGFRIWRVK